MDSIRSSILATNAGSSAIRAALLKRRRRAPVASPPCGIFRSGESSISCVATLPEKIIAHVAIDSV